MTDRDPIPMGDWSPSAHREYLRPRVAHPLAGENAEMVEGFEALVASIHSGEYTSKEAMEAHLRSDDSTYPARMVYFAAAAWERAYLTAPYIGEPLQRQELPPLVEASDGEALAPKGERDHRVWVDEVSTMPRWQPPSPPGQSERIADGVRSIQDDMHQRFTTEAKAQQDATADLIDSLVDLPTLCGPEADSDGGRVAAMYHAVTGQRTTDGADYWRLTPAQQASYDRELRRQDRVARAKAAQQYALAAILAIGAVVALVVGWSVLTNGWRWWA